MLTKAVTRWATASGLVVVVVLGVRGVSEGPEEDEGDDDHSLLSRPLPPGESLGESSSLFIPFFPSAFVLPLLPGTSRSLLQGSARRGMFLLSRIDRS